MIFLNSYWKMPKLSKRVAGQFGISYRELCPVAQKNIRKKLTRTAPIFIGMLRKW